MATMNISLPDQMKKWVEEQVESGRYGNSSDVVRDLVRREQERAEAKAAFESLIEEGFASGASNRSVDDVFAEARLKALGEAGDEA